MAYPMSPPPAQQAGQPPQQQLQSPMPNQFSPPYSNSGSPIPQSPYAVPPPAKRQRLSPDPRSPVNGNQQYSQGQQNGGPGNVQYGNPYAQQTPQQPSQQTSQQPYGAPGYPVSSPQQSTFNTPQPYQQPQPAWPNQQQPVRPASSASPQTSSQMMPPPPRPNKDEKEEKVGVDDINDSLFGSGINLKDEENYFHSIWNNRPTQGSFATNKTTSFSSDPSSQDRSFNVLAPGSSFSDQSNGAFSGTLGQPLTQDEIESELKRKREAAAQAKAERDQHHLKNPFLLGNSLRKKLHTHAYESGVKLDVQGVYERADPPRRPQVMVNGSGTNGVAAVQDAAPSKVDVGVPFEQLLSLLSLASGERIRSLIDDAYGVARARQYGDHGRVVPPEFADISAGEGPSTQETIAPENITGTSWDRISETNANGGDAEKVDDLTAKSVPTISYQGTLTAHLRKIAERDRQAEKERIRRREARRRKAENAGTVDEPMAEASADSVAVDPSAPKMTKKELNKKQKEAANATEAQAINSANTTAAMAFMGKKKNKYGWMTGGMGSVQANKYAKPAPATPTIKQESASTPSGTTPATGGGAAPAVEEKKTPSWGDWREDGVDGKGIQLRDWVHVLERDGREKKALLRASLKLK